MTRTERRRNQYATLAGLFFAALTVWAVVVDLRSGGPPAEVEALRYTSVHVAPGAEGLLDAERARHIIGDRPIVVVAQPDHSGLQRTDVGDVLEDVIVLVVRGDAGRPLTTCGLSDYYNYALTLRVLDAMTFVDGGRDRTAYVEEYVREFDAYVASHFADGPPPRRGPPPGEDIVRARDEMVLVAIAIACGVAFIAMLVFVLREVWLSARRVAQRKLSWHVMTQARLSRVADMVLHGTEAERNATAKGYVLVLGEFESATTQAQRAAVDERLGELEMAVEKLAAEQRTEQRRQSGKQAIEAPRDRKRRERRRRRNKRGRKG